jgi:putative hydrolase of the HAD superfamily
VAITAVIFDIGGVLERSVDTGLSERWEGRLGLPAGTFWDPVRALDPSDDAFTVGRLSAADLRGCLSSAYDLDVAVTEELMADFWDWYCGELDTELVAFFAGLRPRYRTAILTNAMDGAREVEHERYGFEELADVLVYSDEVGLAKPDPAIYRLTCERLGCAPEEALFVDDTQVCVEGARAVGMIAVRCVDATQTIDEVSALLDQRSPMRQVEV